jgi:hypothetical protein
MSEKKLYTTQNDESGDLIEAEVASENEHKGDKKKREIGGREGPDPTRFGDWEKNGRCIDF